MVRRSLRVPLAAAALLAAGLAVPSAHAAAPGAGAAHQVGLPDGLRVVQTSRSLLGTHTWYQQTSHGVPVVGGWYAVHTAYSGGTQVADGRIREESLAAGTLDRAGLIGAASARSAALDTRADGAARVRSATPDGLWLLPARGTSPARYVYAVRTITGRGSWVDYVDAAEARVLRSVKTSVDRGRRGKSLGAGRVLDPNPVAGLQDESLTDHADANSALPTSAYTKVTLRHLKGGTLSGKWVKIVNKNRPVHTNLRFMYFRNAEPFEMVSAYYAIDEAQSYLRSLGFTDVNAEAQKVSTNRVKIDNSWYIPGEDLIEFGSGGVDDAEDLEVVWHEYGHAVQDAQVPGFGASVRAGAIGEGFGDYLAVTMSQPTSPDTATTPWACVADWDAVSYTSTTPHCLRRTDGDKMFPADIHGEVHDDGEIWSRALWDINVALGRDIANRIIVEAQFSFAPNTGFAAAAQTTVDTAAALYDQPTADVVQQAFADRGILAPPV